MYEYIRQTMSNDSNIFTLIKIIHFFLFFFIWNPLQLKLNEIIKCNDALSLIANVLNKKN